MLRNVSAFMILVGIKLSFVIILENGLCINWQQGLHVLPYKLEKGLTIRILWNYNHLKN